MNVVITKHENCGAKYVFLVPEDKTLKAGDLVKINTKCDEALATCLCDSFTVDTTDKEKMKNIFNAFCIDEPTVYVVGKLTYEKWE
jgi:hypothetical protein